MNFAYKTRDASGKLRKGKIDSSSRAEALDTLRSNGITVIEITPDNSQDRSITKHSSAFLIGLSSFLLVIVIIFIGVMFIPYQTEKTQPEKLSTVEAKVKNISESIKTNSLQAKNDESSKGQAPQEMPEGNVSNACPARSPKFFRPTKVLEDGTVVELRPPPAIKNPIERAFAAVATPGGMAIPFAAALRRFTPEQIREMIDQPVEFMPEDSEAIIQKKIAVQQVKDSFKEYLQSGKTLEQAIYEVDRQMKKESVKLATAYRGLAMVIQDGDAEAVNRYVELTNKQLTESGLRQLSVPPKFKINQKDER